MHRIYFKFYIFSLVIKENYIMRNHKNIYRNSSKVYRSVHRFNKRGSVIKSDQLENEEEEKQHELSDQEQQRVEDDEESSDEQFEQYMINNQMKKMTKEQKQKILGQYIETYKEYKRNQKMKKQQPDRKVAKKEKKTAKKQSQNQQFLVSTNRNLNIAITTLIVVISTLLIIHTLFHYTILPINEPIKSNQIQKQPQIEKKVQGNIKTQIKQIQLKDHQKVDNKNDNNTLKFEQKQILSEVVKPSPAPISQIIKINSHPSNSAPFIKQRYSQTLNLKDFTSDPVYQMAPIQIRDIFDEMIKRPPQRRSPPNFIFMPSEKAYFAYRLFLNPDNQNYLKAESYYYETKYNINKFSNELPLCIVAPGRNLASGNSSYKRFIDSIQRQNYSNYRLVYIDDASEDNSAFYLQDYVKRSAGLLSKLVGASNVYQGSFIIDEQPYKNNEQTRRLLIIKNKQRLYALANRNNAIRNYCPQNSIILDTDADDSLIGKQALKIVNAIYHNQQVWMFNSVFIYDKSLQKQVTTGPQDGVPLQILQQNTYRSSQLWKTSQLRTFKAQLFKKINESDFKNENGTFYQWASDYFTQQPLVQLAGPLHYKHLYEILYFYDWNFKKTTVYQRRHYRDIVLMQTPYKPLQTLDAKAEKVQNYVVPQIIKRQYEKNLIQGRNEAKKYGNKVPF